MIAARSIALVLMASVAVPVSAQAPYQTPVPASPAAQSPAAKSSQPQVNVSKGAAAKLAALQKAVNAKDVANIPARLAEAKAVAKTPDDRYFIGEMQLKAAIDAKNNEAAAAAADYIAASGFANTARVIQVFSALGGAYYGDKDFVKAEAMFRKALALAPNNPKTMVLVGEALHGQGKNVEAAMIMHKALTIAQASGAKLEEKTYKRAVGIAFDGKSTFATTLGRMWVRAYPGPQSWANTIAIYRQANDSDDVGTLALMRLLRVNKALREKNAYLLYGGTAADVGNFAEARAVLEEGVAAGMIDPKAGIGANLLTEVRAKPVASVAELDSSAKTAKTPTAKMALGNRYLGIGEYAKAAEMYRAALDAGANANAANLQLGVALAMAGDKAGAIAALKAVGSTYSDIASFWLIHLGEAA